MSPRPSAEVVDVLVVVVVVVVVDVLSLPAGHLALTRV